MVTNLLIKKEILAADLFAGAGGFTMSAQNLGIQVAAAIEFDRHAAATYRDNFIGEEGKAPHLFEEDITQLSPSRFMREAGIQKGKLDIVMGGPPCQGFSTHRINDAGVDDERNELLIRYFQFVRTLRPKIFVVENVPGLLWARHASYLEKFMKQAEESGYNVFEPVLLNARDFGVPQNRKRVFIVGTAKELVGEPSWPPTPTHGSPKACKEDDDLLPWVTAATVFKGQPPKDDPNNVHMNHTPELVEVFKNTPKNGGSRWQSGRVLKCHDQHDGHKDVYGRINPKLPGPTMTTACINPSKGRFVHPTQNHGITLRQAARFQTFPDDFVFQGGLMAAGKQIGNAVPVKLGEAVLLPLLQCLTEVYAGTAGRDNQSAAAE